MSEITIELHSGMAPEEWRRAMAKMEEFGFGLEIAPADEIIRCKDCKWFGQIGCAIGVVDDTDKPTENDYCSFAERRTEETDEEAYEEALEEFRKNPKTYTLGEVEAELGLTTELMLNSPITPEQWDMLEDVDFDHTDRIWFHTKHDKDVAFVKERKGKWIVHKSPDEYHCGMVECPFCGEELIAEPNEYCFCPNCGARMEE